MLRAWTMLLESAGNNNEDRMVMMAKTTSSSIKVKAGRSQSAWHGRSSMLPLIFSKSGADAFLASETAARDSLETSRGIFRLHSLLDAPIIFDFAIV